MLHRREGLWDCISFGYCGLRCQDACHSSGELWTSVKWGGVRTRSGWSVFPANRTACCHQVLGCGRSSSCSWLNVRREKKKKHNKNNLPQLKAV